MEFLKTLEANSSPIYNWTEIKQKQLHVSYTQLFPRNSVESKLLFGQLEEEVSYLTGELSRVKVFGKWYPVPRQQVSYGDCGITYTYSGVTLPTKSWIPVLKGLKNCVEKVTGFRYNFVLVNRYADGEDYVGEHKDSEKAIDPNVPIASLSFGASRDFYFKHGDHRKGDKSEPVVSVLLEDGMLLLMNPPTNKFWYHSLPVRKSCKNVRISLTFRRILNSDSDK